MTRQWLGLTDWNFNQWSAFTSIKEWWISVANLQGALRRSIASLIMLICWELWNERNARVFRNFSTMPTVIFDKIKKEAILWSIAGANHLGNIMPRE